MYLYARDRDAFPCIAGVPSRRALPSAAARQPLLLGTGGAMALPDAGVTPYLAGLPVQWRPFPMQRTS
jgi:hypothetical protein